MKNLFLGGRRGQGIKNNTRNTNMPKMTLKTFYKPFLLKSIKCMDTICVVQFLNYKSVMEVFCFKPSSCCVNGRSLYPRSVVAILIKRSFLRGGTFLNNHSNVVLAWIFFMIYITCPKMGNDALTFL